LKAPTSTHFSPRSGRARRPTAVLRHGAERVILLLTAMLDSLARDSWQILGRRLGA
jgi:hypothetical protein